MLGFFIVVSTSNIYFAIGFPLAAGTSHVRRDADALSTNSTVGTSHFVARDATPGHKTTPNTSALGTPHVHRDDDARSIAYRVS